MKSDKRLHLIGCLPLVMVSVGLLACRSLVVTFILYHSVICLMLPLLAARLQKGEKRLSFLGLRGGRTSVSLALGLFLGVILLAVIKIFFFSLGEEFLDGAKLAANLRAWGLSDLRHPLFLVYFVVGNSLVEELFWRGFLLGRFLRSSRPLAACLLVSFYFVQYHVLTVFLLFSPGALPVLTPLLFVGSLGWCYLRLVTRDIYAVALSHLMVDLGLIVVYLSYV